MLEITPSVRTPISEIALNPIRAQGPGGQNVNKVSSAIHLRFDVHASSLPDTQKARILALRDRRITSEGVIIIKAQSCRTQLQNKQDALARLQVLLASALTVRKARRPTKPSWGSMQRARNQKTQRSSVKSLRKKVRRTED